MAAGFAPQPFYLEYGMNLQDFITTALSQIAAGVAEAKVEAAKHGATVGSIKTYGNVAAAKIVTDDQERPISTVEFDIALSEANAKDTKGGIGVFLGSVGMGSQGSTHGETSSHSRVKFSVSIVFPGE